MAVDATRLRERIAAVGLTQSSLARRVGVTQGTIAKLVSGRHGGSSHLHRIARELGTTPEYLAGETEDPDAGALPAPTPTVVAEQLDAVMVPHLYLSYGLGERVLERADVLEHVAFSRSWLQSRIGGTVDQVRLVTGEGDSMEPTIRDGDAVLIDLAQRTMRQADQLWAIAVRDTGSIKRLRRGKGGGYVILSDNDRVPPDHADDGEMEIVGKVIGIFRWQ